MTALLKYLDLLLQEIGQKWDQASGAVLEGFLRFPETTQDFPSTMGAPLFGYNVSRGIHSRLNSGVSGFCFDSKLRKCSEDHFFWSPQRKIIDLRKNLCCSITGNSVRRFHRTRTVKVRDKPVWKPLSEICRTAPAREPPKSQISLLMWFDPSNYKNFNVT